VLVGITVAATMVGCQSNAPTAAKSAAKSRPSANADWAVLQRPLHLPTLQGGGSCPLSSQQVAHSLSPEFGFAPALGTGPTYPEMTEMRGGVLLYDQAYSQSHYKDGWAYSKVLWMAKPDVNGNVLIRGRQIDGPNAIGFGMGDVPDPELQWHVLSQGGWGSLPSETRIRAPGCYAYQVDSQAGSQVIVFQVVAA
jgi:hypothetical protein